MSQHVGSWEQPGVEGRTASPCPANSWLLCGLDPLPDLLRACEPLLVQPAGEEVRPDLGSHLASFCDYILGLEI